MEGQIQAAEDLILNLVGTTEDVGVILGKAPYPVFLGCFLVGSSRVDLQACKLEYSIVSPK